MDEARAFGSIAVIGGGAWGTALANLAAVNGRKTILWAREPAVVDAVNGRRENTVYLPGVSLHDGLTACGDVDGLKGAEALMLAAPAQHTRALLTDFAPTIAPDRPLAICSKGIEAATGLLMTDLLHEVAPDAPAAILSGPSFAADVARGLPTAVTIASADADIGARWIASLGAPHFRPYLSSDLKGVALGGAVKNVLAIAAGVVVGRRLGESAKAALIARGFAEFQRLGVALGAAPQTMAGLSGLGDLILTASSPQSRNMSLGMALGEGASLDAILSARSSVAEGVATAPAVVAMARRLNVETPICAAVADLVAGERSVDDVIQALLSRPFRQEAPSPPPDRMRLV